MHAGQSRHLQRLRIFHGSAVEYVLSTLVGQSEETWYYLTFPTYTGRLVFTRTASSTSRRDGRGCYDNIEVNNDGCEVALVDGELTPFCETIVGGVVNKLSSK